MVKGGDAAKLSMSPQLFDALGDIPIELRNTCVDGDRCFAPDPKGTAKASGK